MHELYFTLFLYELYEWNIDLKWDNNQKQPPEMFFEKRCSQKFHKIHRKTHVSESLF